MNTKLIIYAIIILLIGMAIGAVGRKEYDREEFNSAVKLADSLTTIETERQRVHDILIKEKTKKVNQGYARIKQRDENFKNDTTILSSDELFQRIGAINNHN